MYDLELKIQRLKRFYKKKKLKLQVATDLGNTYTTEETSAVC